MTVLRRVLARPSRSEALLVLTSLAISLVVTLLIRLSHHGGSGPDPQLQPYTVTVTNVPQGQTVTRHFDSGMTCVEQPETHIASCSG